jgi:hypothetical protein
MLGSAAADLAQGLPLPDGTRADGDVMVGCRGPRVIATPLDEVVAHSPREVTRDSELYQLSQKLMLRAEQPF